MKWNKTSKSSHDFLLLFTMSSIIKKLAGETVLYGFSSIFSRILNFVFLAAYFTRKLSLEEYGVFSELYLYLAVILAIIVFRLDTALFRFSSKNNRHSILSQLLSIQFLISLLFFLFIYYFSNNIASLLDYPENGIYIQFIAGILFLDSVIALPFAQLRINNKALKFAILKSLSIIVNILMILLFFEWWPSSNFSIFSISFNPNKYLEYIFISNLVASFTILLFFLPDFLSVRWKLETKFLNKILKYIWPLVLVAVAGILNNNIAISMQKYILKGTLIQNLQSVGIYSAALKIAVLMSLFTTAFNYAAEPFFFNYSKETDNKAAYSDVAYAFTIVGSLLFLAITLYLDIFQLLIGEEFRSGLYLTPILVLAFLFLGLYYNFSIWYKLADKTIYGAIISIIGLTITFSGNYWGLETWGQLASAVSLLVCYFTMSVFALYFGKKYYPIYYPLKKISLVLLLSIFLFILNYYSNTFLELPLIPKLFYNTIYLIIYILLIYKFNVNFIKKIFH